MRVTAVTLRVGDAGASTTWGVDAHASDVRVFRSLHARLSASVWRQPPVLSDTTSAPLKTGGAGLATVAVPLRKFTHAGWLRLSVTAGYKSEGFFPGEQLRGGAILRVGLTATHP